MLSVNDIFNRPPSISEDALQYTLYLPPDQTDRVSATALAALLTEHAEILLPSHIWHRDAFELKVAADPEGNQDVWVLEGRMRVGDCIDDEWCTVWLLRELSKQWDLVVSIFDSDGEFLLIEAAEELPSWVTPTNAENRLRLHLVPLSHVSPPSGKTRRKKYDSREDSDEENGVDGKESDSITAADAIRLVRDPLVDTFAPENVQAAVWKRIAGYPAASRQHMHVAKACLPVDVAKALTVNPLLVQKAVEAFYTRDGLQLRAAQKMSRFSPEPAVLASVKMSRTAYAQLQGQKFHPPKVFGRWQSERDVGMKIACGFEMLFQESKSRKEAMSTNLDGTSSSVRHSQRDPTEQYPDDPAGGRTQRQPAPKPGIHPVHPTPAVAGYFKDEAEGSQLWTTLETQAAAAFVAARRDDDATRPSFATTVQSALNDHTDDRGFTSEAEDPDDWLNVDASDFDTMLEKTMGVDKGKGRARADGMDVDGADAEDRVAKAQAERLRDLAKKDGDSDDDDEGFLGGDDGDGDGDGDESDMDEDEPSARMAARTLTDEQRAARQAAMDKLVPALDPSEYGAMPASFHSNSQRVAPVTLKTEVHDALDTNASPITQNRPVRPPILPRDHFDGVDSDDETDEEVPADEEEDEEGRPQIVGEIEIDMTEETDEFIEFARQALGVSDDQWDSILKERDERGGQERNIPKELRSAAPHTEVPQSDAANPLDSFEAVMKAVDAELARSQGRPRAEQNACRSSGSRGKSKVTESNEDDIDIEAAMQAEVDELLEPADDDESAGADYTLIKNFLESFKSQGGLSGPVGALAGRLQRGWTFPRDES
ncbi:SGT1 protein-domain-containing protein [Epithele typhae]|uniref:SGT1 protein-domain-containing protein n=1 Tax=Epithele typhae TaxID=378194 RepID=UPI0020072875|nr:SGT1 protein-domain-containing protein [Epithele typhae]KAH9922003.1 SGT1 protein-domain-containing protein [Epithele typhae]